MKVVHVITGLHVGGAESMLLKLLETMDRTRFQQTVIALMPGGENRARIEAAGFPVFDLGMKQGLPTLSSVLTLRRLARELLPDVVQGWMYHGNLAASLMGKFAPGRPRVFWNIRHSVADLGREKRSTRLAIQMGARLSGHAERIICNSSVSLEQHALLGYRLDREVMIPNGFDLTRFKPSETARAELFSELDLPLDSLLVGMAARRHPMKGHEAFLEAAGILVPGERPVHFLLAGRGVTDADARLRELAGADGLTGRVHLLGQRKDMPGFLAGLDLLCVPSLFGEGFPNVLGEAMGCGVPCLATDVGESREIVGPTGRIVPPGDTPALAAGMQFMLEVGDREKRERSQACRDRILDNYSMGKIAGI
jgi:glycosyltransferase involved in cell wall biosynthesis